MGVAEKVNNKNEVNQRQRGTSDRYREILIRLISVKTPIKSISECSKNGDMSFFIDAKDLGISYDEFYKYLDEIFTPFIADFLGELLIRENLDLFVPHLTQFNTNEFSDAISGGDERRQHKRFGMKVNRGNIEFRFQASLLHDILTEDFRHVVS